MQCGALALCAGMFIVLYIGLLQTDSGRTALLRLHSDIRISIARHPTIFKYLWPVEKVMGAMSGFLLFMPVFMLDGGDQVKVMQRMQSIDGDFVPFFHGVAHTRHQDVAGISSAPQHRGWLLGAFHPSPQCLPSDTLIFVPNGPDHARIRTTIKKLVQGLIVKPGDVQLRMTEEAEALQSRALQAYSDRDIARGDQLMDQAWKQSLVATIFAQMFERELSQSQVDLISQYMDKAPGACVLDSSLWLLTWAAGLGSVQHIRAFTTELVKSSPVGKRAPQIFAEVYKQSFGQELSGDILAAATSDFLRQLADGFLFAGLLGTSGLAKQTFKRIRDNPNYYYPKWNESSVAFLIETSRLDPPVTWFSNIAEEPVEVHYPRWGPVTYPAGTPVVYLIGTANRDRAVFGGPTNSRQRAEMFDPKRPELRSVLTWNGLEQAWSKDGALNTTLAPRGCPGRALSQATVVALVDAFGPRQPPNFLEDASATADGDYYFTHIPVMDDIGWALWSFTCALFIVWLLVLELFCYSSRSHVGSISLNYIGYLAAQGTNGLVWIFMDRGSTVWFYHLQNLAAVFYLRIFLVSLRHWAQRRRLTAAKKASALANATSGVSTDDDSNVSTTAVSESSGTGVTSMPAASDDAAPSAARRNRTRSPGRGGRGGTHPPQLQRGNSAPEMGPGPSDLDSLPHPPPLRISASADAALSSDEEDSVEMLLTASGSPAHAGSTLRSGVKLAYASAIPDWPVWTTFIVTCCVIQLARAVDPEFNLQMFVGLFYGPAALLVMYTVVTFLLDDGYRENVYVETEHNSPSQRAMSQHRSKVEKWYDALRDALPPFLRALIPPSFEGGMLLLGVFGGLWGIADLFWPALMADGQAFHLLSRVGDSLLYVPFVVHAIPVMDSLVAQSDVTARNTFTAALGWSRMQASSLVDLMAPRQTAMRRRARARCSFWTLVIGFVTVVLTSAAMYTAVQRIVSAPLCNWTGNLNPMQDIPSKPDFTCPNVDIQPESRAPPAPLPDSACGPVANSQLQQLDWNTKLLYQVLSRYVLDDQGATPNGDTVKVPRWQRPLKKRTTVFGVPVPVEDEDAFAGDFNAGIQDFVMQMMRSRLFFGDTDTDVDLHFDYSSAEQGRDVLLAASRAKTRLPPSLIPWFDMTSDLAMSKFAFNGLAAQNMKRVTQADRRVWNELPGSPSESFISRAEYMADYTWMSGLEVRAGYEPYGANAIFDAEGTILGIVWSNAPSKVSLAEGAWISPESVFWNRAKFVWRSSAVVGVTLADHLVGVHLLLSNAAVTATREKLPVSHPIRRLLTPFTYYTVSINRGSIATLLSRNSMLHRAVGLTWNGLKAGFLFASEHVQFGTATEQIEARGMLDAPEWLYPWGADMRRYDAIVQKFVRSYVTTYLTDVHVHADADLRAWDEGLHEFSNTLLPRVTDVDSLVSVLSTIIVKVTAMHLQVGRVTSYVADASWASSKISSYNLAQVQTSLQMLNIAMVTGKAQPMLLANYDHLIVGHTHKRVASAKAAWHTFRADLCELAYEIDVKNANAEHDAVPLTDSDDMPAQPSEGRQRRFPCNGANPKLMSSAVSI